MRIMTLRRVTCAVNNTEIPQRSRLCQIVFRGRQYPIRARKASLRGYAWRGQKYPR
jgi:hypothetical protein